MCDMTKLSDELNVEDLLLSANRLAKPDPMEPSTRARQIIEARDLERHGTGRTSAEIAEVMRADTNRGMGDGTWRR